MIGDQFVLRVWLLPHLSLRTFSTALVQYLADGARKKAVKYVFFLQPVVMFIHLVKVLSCRVLEMPWPVHSRWSGTTFLSIRKKKKVVPVDSTAERKLFLYETAHIKVCWLSWATRSWFLESLFTFFKCIFCPVSTASQVPFSLIIL